MALSIHLLPLSPAEGAAFSPAGCEIAYVSDPHETSSPGARSVKVNAKIQCQKPVDDLVLTVRLYKAPSKQTAKTTTENSGQAFLLNEGTYTPCANDESTEWYGKGYGASCEEGRLYFSDPGGIRSNTVALFCGDG